jgi:hypothetical protein
MKERAFPFQKMSSSFVLDNAFGFGAHFSKAYIFEGEWLLANGNWRSFT